MNSLYKIRISFVFAFFCLLYLIILANVYYIQIYRHSFFLDLAQKQYFTHMTILPPRAIITDRTGNHFFAMNKESYAAFIMPPKLKEKPAVEKFLKKHFPQAIEKLHGNPKTPFMYVGRRLTPAQKKLIENSGLEDMHLLTEPSRFYPVSSASPIIGMTNIDNKGIAGMELLFDKQLSGTPSSYFLQKDARSGHFYFNRDTELQGIDGTPIQLTIDGNLQFLAHEELKSTIKQFGAKEGAVLIMNPKTGEILAMVTEPAFDSNDSKHIDLAHMKNRVITEVYELGSVIKAFAALAALEEGVVTIDEEIDCQNVATTYIDGRKVNTVNKSILGVAPFWQVIKKSNNIGIAKVTKRIDTKLYDHYRRLGFGKKTGIQFPGEREGFVNPPDRWSKQSIFSLSYGYEINASLLQLACAFSIVVNGGFAVKPTLLLDHIHPINTAQKPLYKPETLQTLRTILENNALQTASRKALSAGYRILGKTGTANILIDGVYDTTKNIFTYVGVVEKEEYQRVIVTFVKEIAHNGLLASQVAAPLFERIAEKTIINDKII